MTSFLSLVERDSPEDFASAVLPWVHEAGNPYFDWLFGGHAEAVGVLESWLARGSSEISVTRAEVLLDEEEAMGGFMALGGADLVRCRKADTMALLKIPDVDVRKATLARLATVRDLFAAPAEDQFYLSKMGISKSARGRGFGRALVERYIERGRESGFTRYCLDVAAGNAAAIRLYESHGFGITRRTSVEEAGLAYIMMTREG